MASIQGQLGLIAMIQVRGNQDKDPGLIQVPTTNLGHTTKARLWSLAFPSAKWEYLVPLSALQKCFYDAGYMQ